MQYQYQFKEKVLRQICRFYLEHVGTLAEFQTKACHFNKANLSAVIHERLTHSLKNSDKKQNQLLNFAKSANI